MAPPAKALFDARELILMMWPRPKRTIRGATSAACQEHAFQVRVQNRIPVSFGPLVEGTENAYSRVVDENFDLAELTACLLDHSVDVFRAGHIRRDWQSLYAVFAESCSRTLDLIAASVRTWPQTRPSGPTARQWPVRCHGWRQ